MQITEVTVHVSTTFGHPVEKYSNFKPGVTLRAELEPGENAFDATRRLQALAESTLEAERAAILARLTPAPEPSDDSRQMRFPGVPIA